MTPLRSPPGDNLCCLELRIGKGHRCNPAKGPQEMVRRISILSGYWRGIVTEASGVALVGSTILSVMLSLPQPVS